ncbi:hypothetical protein SADUNF_Sadunf08G0090600 [Salix dunnii]|uniref:Uncharacterized protein n=1 Tax=Salix dunnii TaxID=1413687 RepID=A0A835MXP5_9ROSI|nr:hypothetical protein SADUNF_Sadunf08G0090600 [Salix dunnii]
MPLRCPNLLRLLKCFSATSTLLISLPFLLPCILFGFVFIIFLFVLILPFLCSFISSCLIFKVVSLEMKCIPLFGTKFGATRSKTVEGASKYYNIAGHEKVDDLGLKVKQGSFIKVDPSWELLSFDESDEEKHKKQEDDPEVDGRENQCTYDDDSWQILVPNSCTKREEHKTFFELLSFWRKKEKERYRRCLN